MTTVWTGLVNGGYIWARVASHSANRERKDTTNYICLDPHDIATIDL